MKKLIALLLALSLVSAACGSDDDPSPQAGESENTQQSTDATTEASDEPAEGTDDGDVPTIDASSAECAEIQTAFDRFEEAQNLALSNGGGEQPTPEEFEAEVQASIDSMAVLRDEVPDDLKDDVDTLERGLKALDEALAGIDYDIDSLASNPSAALEFAQTALNEDVVAMTEAGLALSNWVISNCSS